MNRFLKQIYLDEVSYLDGFLKPLRRLVQLAKSGTARWTYLMVGANTVAAFLAFGAILLVARGLSTAEFGVFSALTVFMVLVASVGDVGIGASLARFIPRSLAGGEKREVEEYLRAASWCIGGLAVGLGGIVVWLAPGLQSWVFPNAGVGLLRVVGVGVGLTLVYGFLTSALQAFQRFTQAAVITVTYGVVRLSLVGPLWLVGELSLERAVWIFCLSSLLGVVLGWVFLPTKWRWEVPGKGAFRELLGFSGWLGVNQSVSAVSSRLDVVLLNRLGGAYQAGIYAAAARMDSFFVLLVNSLAAVFAPRLVQLREVEQQKRFVKKVGLVVGGIVGGMGLLVAAAPWVMELLFGAKYADAVLAFRVLTVGMMLFVGTIPVMLPVIYVLGRTRTVAWLAVVQLAVILVINLRFISVWGPIAPAVAWGVAQGVVLVVGGWLTGRWMMGGGSDVKI